MCVLVKISALNFKRNGVKKRMSNDFTSLNEECLIALADYYGARRDRKSGADMYTCPVCKSGEHGTGSTGAFHIGRNKNGKISFYCHSCGRFGNIASLWCEYHGVENTKQNFPKIIRGIKSDLGMPIEDTNYQDFKNNYRFKGEITNDDLNPQTTVETEAHNYSSWFKYTLWKNRSHAVNYLKTREIENAEKIAYDFSMGYGEYKWDGTDTVNAVFVPMFEDYNFNSEAVYSFSWRAVDQDLKKKRGKIRPLVPECLKPNSKDTTKKWVYLVEGEYDFFSILDIQYSIEKEGKTCEFSAISINSAGNLSRFIDELYQNGIISSDIGLIIALDNDKKFNQNVENFKAKGYRMAQKYRIPCIIADVKTLYLGEKDSNEALKKDRAKFQQALKLTVEQAKLLDINTYMKECEQMEKEIQEQNNNVVAHQDGVGENSNIEEMSRPGVVDWVSYLDYDRYDRVKNTLNNIDLILRNDSEFSGKIQYNEFTCRKQFERENWTDKDDSRIKLYIERKYGIKNVTVDNIVHACNILTDENKYHPIKDYLNGLKWDGVNRIETLFIDFLGAKDNEYTRKVAKITLISAIARIYNPGCKVDTVTCLVGSQGIGKSKFISKISVNPDWFTDSVSSFDGKEFYETIQGKWIVEIGEGTAFKKSLKETAKQKIASQQDTYRTPYARYVEDRPRQCIFIATTNSYDFLKDETGDRRYYPIDCEKKKARLSIDKNLNKEYISQLWAEAKELYTRGEEVYITDERIINLAEQEQKAHFDESPLQSDIYNFLDILLPPLSDWYSWGLDRRRRYIQAVQSGEDTSKSLGVSGVYRRDRVSVKEIMCELYNYDLNQPIDRKLSLDVTRSLTALGWSKSGKSLRIKPYGKVWIYEKY